MCFGNGIWTINPSTSGSALSRSISPNNASSVISSSKRNTVDRKPISRHARSLCPTYVSLAPSCPTSIATKYGFRSIAATRSAIRCFSAAATAFPSISSILSLFFK